MSVHHNSNNSLDNPLCNIPGLAITTQGPSSSNFSKSTKFEIYLKSNGFDDNWTAGMTDRMRYFCMGNALVVDIVAIMGKRIEEIETSDETEIVQLELL